MDKNTTKKTPPRNVAIVVPDIDALTNSIRNALKAQQTYTKSLEYAIKVAAGNYMAYLKCLASVNKRAKVIYPIETREGSKAYKTYPDVEMLPTLSRALKDSLKALGLTVDTIDITDEDPLDTLASKLDSLTNG